jgi:hypothetical protein
MHIPRYIIKLQQNFSTSIDWIFLIFALGDVAVTLTDSTPLTVFPIVINYYLFMATAGCGIYAVDKSVEAEVFVTFGFALISTVFYFTDFRCVTIYGCRARVGLFSFVATFTTQLFIIFALPFPSLLCFIFVYLKTKEVETAANIALRPFHNNIAYYYNEQMASQGNHWIKDKILLLFDNKNKECCMIKKERESERTRSSECQQNMLEAKLTIQEVEEEEEFNPLSSPF